MEQTKLTPSGKPFDIHERLLLFADGASSHRDFIAKNRIALKDAKDTRFRLRVCQRTRLLSPEFYAVVQQSDELVRFSARLSIRRCAIRQRLGGTSLRPCT
jgi:hypothetical protein